MTVLLNTAPPDGIEALVVWVSAIGETRANRPPGAVFPYYMIERPAVTDDQITQRGTYRVSTFGVATGNLSAMYVADQAARLAERRVLALAPRFGPQQPVTLSSGLVVFSDGVKTMLGPAREQYTDDNSIERFIAEYQIDWRFIAA